MIGRLAWLVGAGLLVAACGGADLDDIVSSEEGVKAGRRCAGPAERACGAGQYCETRSPGQCPGASAFGRCAVQPEVCTREYNPVCGCDDRTYGNACEAAHAGVAVARVGACEPEPELGPFCGGIAGIPCEGAASCIDDPRDECDPEAGGADCGGVCACDSIGLCVEGFQWDASPEVCNCVPTSNPCAAVLCPVDTRCVPVGNSAVCEPIVTDPCATVRCPGGTQCVAEGDSVSCEPLTGEPCGRVTCAEGLTCCNASCGMCVPPGRSCIQIACE